MGQIEGAFLGKWNVGRKRPATNKQPIEGKQHIVIVSHVDVCYTLNMGEPESRAAYPLFRRG